MSRARAVCSALLLASCGGGHASPDAAPAGPCWPLDATAGGQATLGTGDVAYEPMPDTLSIIVNGSQADPFLEIHSRIQGIPPGNAIDILDPSNPHTKASAVIDELGLTLGVECPASLGYVASPGVAGDFDLVHSLRLGLRTIPPAQLDGKQARITLEVVGSNGLYAQDMKIVTLAAPRTAP